MITGRQLVEEYRKTIGKYNYDQRDCIGSIWKILEKYGAKTDLVGSNWFARHELRNMRPLTDRSQLFDGCAVLKTKLLGESGYDLPPRYISDADLIDYNHIGIGTDQGEILDSTRYMSGGIYVRNGPGVSTAEIGPNSWDIIGEFEDVDYERIVIPLTQLYVTAERGSTVNLRSRPDKEAAVILKVPVGSIVGLIDSAPGYKNIEYNGRRGWMVETFLTDTHPSLLDQPVPIDRTALFAEQETLLNRLLVIHKALKEA